MDRALDVVSRLKGPVVPVNVCFNEDGTVDYPAVSKYVDWLCEQGVPVLLLTYGSSEYPGLSDDEIWRLTEEVAAAAAGRSLFITSTGWWKPATCREFLRHADGVGADAVKVQINVWMPKTKEVLLGYFHQVQNACDIPLLAWAHTPPPFPVEVAAELATRPNVVGIKNDGHPFYDYYDLVRATRDQDFAVISGGQMRSFVFGHQLGSPAYLCTIAPFRPDISLEFHRRLTEGSVQEAWEIVFQYEEPWLRHAAQVGWLQAIKSALRWYGLYPNNRLSPPSGSASPEEYRDVGRVLETIFGPAENAAL